MSNSKNYTVKSLNLFFVVKLLKTHIISWGFFSLLLEALRRRHDSYIVHAVLDRCCKIFKKEEGLD